MVSQKLGLGTLLRAGGDRGGGGKICLPIDVAYHTRFDRSSPSEHATPSRDKAQNEEEGNVVCLV